MNSCELGIHCGGKGEIEVLVVAADKYVCLLCAAGEENLTIAEVRDDLSNPQYWGRIQEATVRGQEEV